MPKPIEAVDFLAQPAKYPAAPICVVYGDDAFLQRQVILELRHAILGTDDAEFSLATFDGNDKNISMRDVLDELSTTALFGSGQRLVIVEDADPFITRFRPDLEDYVAKPRPKAVLALAPTTWASNTRLFKAIADSGLQIECKTPSPARLVKWLVEWAKRRHKVKLEPAAADTLVDIVEPELGLFDQELAKLAAFAGESATVTAEMVREVVGGWRTKTTWDMLDAAANGDARDALTQLDRLLLGGEVPIALLGQIASSLRRFAAATRYIEQGEADGRRINLRQALEASGVKPFVIGKAEGQMRQLGRMRGGKLYEWLLEIDLALKGESSAPMRARLELEQLIARMAKTAERR